MFDCFSWSCFDYSRIFENGLVSGAETFAEIFKFVALVLYYMYLFKSKDIKKLISSLAISFALESIFQAIFTWIIMVRMEIPSMMVRYFLLIVLICIAVILFMGFISKTKIIDYLRGWLTVGFISLPITTVYLIVLFSGTYYSFLLNTELYMVVGAIIYIISFFVLGAIARDFYIKRQLQQSKIMLAQQLLYVNKLEKIQQELRMFQHDYKNIISGLYFQADKGNTEAIKEYINNKILNIDDEVQNDIHQINQLVKIVNMELKSLLLVKLAEANKTDVQIDFEVLYEVRKIPLDASDFMRIMGILLDNAIEEAQTTDTKKVSVVILQEEDKTTIIVKNDISNNVDMSNIWKDGYSTKGNNRGLGLSSYQKILNNYNNTFCETKIDGKQFTQILIIT